VLPAVIKEIDAGSIDVTVPDHRGHGSASPRFVWNADHPRVEH